MLHRARLQWLSIVVAFPVSVKMTFGIFIQSANHSHPRRLQSARTSLGKATCVVNVAPFHGIQNPGSPLDRSRWEPRHFIKVTGPRKFAPELPPVWPPTAHQPRSYYARNGSKPATPLMSSMGGKRTFRPGHLTSSCLQWCAFKRSSSVGAQSWAFR